MGAGNHSKAPYPLQIWFLVATKWVFKETIVLEIAFFQNVHLKELIS